VTLPLERHVRAYIGLGSNLNHPQRQIQAALAALDRLPLSVLSGRSSLYRSKPLADLDQPDYVNAVAVLDTALQPLQLLAELQAIENRQGRGRTSLRWASRSLDLDILLYGDRRLQSPALTLPHPGLCERDFVLYPLYEIAPDLMIPGHGSLHECLAGCPLRGLQRIEESIETDPS
jgi:2-amino-4-hydroxy-6-hydroxymethyldihydropteridine diphosphokinase